MEKIFVSPDGNGANEITKLLDNFIAAHRNYFLVRDKFHRIRDRVLKLYEGTLLSYAKAIEFGPLATFSSNAITALGYMTWPSGPEFNDAIHLSLTQPKHANHKLMDGTYNGLTNSHLTAFLFKLFEGLVEFIPDLCEQVGKRHYKAKSLSIADIGTLDSKIRASMSFETVFDFELDVSSIKSADVAKNVTNGFNAVRDFRWSGYLNRREDAAASPKALEGMHIALVKCVRDLIIGVFDIQRIIFEPDINAEMLTEIISRIHGGESADFQRKHKAAFDCIRNSSDLLHENMDRYYESYIRTNNALEMSTAYIQDIVKGLEGGGDNTLVELVNHYLEKAREKIVGRSDSSAQGATLATLQTLVNRITVKRPVSEDALRALDRVGNVARGGGSSKGV
jgi:hypothetical protein